MKFEMDNENLRYPRFKGVFIAVVTPFSDQAKNSLDKAGATRLINFLLDKGVDGLFIFGSTGEGPLVENYKGIYSELIDLIPSDTTVIVQTGRSTLDTTLEFTRLIEEDGRADAAALMPPQFYSMDQKRLQGYFETVLDEIRDVPVFLYDIPQFTSNNIEPSLLANLAKDYDNLAGIKSSSPDFVKLMKLINLKKHDLSIFVGNDQFIYSGLCYGAQGLVSGPANALPEPYMELYKHVRNKDLKEAIKEQKLINDFIQSVIKSGSNISRIKQAINSREIELNDFSLSFPPNIGREARSTIKENMKDFLNGDRR